ncbi:TRAP transporter substrate-binding protein [Enterovirga rhinocerotis]|uniref:Tripartite ATP-independent transporter DctP family solute receptor n=1 Tax=Enterovirga rhinocerotis TaxID=1339210 RepID=A0A4R7C4F7_9HYPH|nr:TRAP transporter substrate-binding protein [Enterovirga rhinocerotis]TDR93420.1 tripartite ATP-independent transporter DctP family solute receptor [Enterovirga rhinocerotis]
MSTTFDRRRMLKFGALAGTAVAAPAILTWPASAAQFSYKVANNLPQSHPMNVRLAEAIKIINEQSGGQLEFKAFPNNQLGADTDMLSQLRSGALEFFTLSGGILSTLIPAVSIYNTAFIFKDYSEVWPAMDGPLGGYLRGLIEKTGIHPMSKLWNNGFRQITSSTRPIATPQDIKGFKIRVAVSPLFISLFKALEAAPTAINFAEVYTALQTKVVEGQENALVLIDSAKFFEVQKYVSLTNHGWDAFFMLSNGRAWRALPPKLQELVAENLDKAALAMREDTMKLDQTLEIELKKKGMIFNRTEPAPFREVLRKNGFYAEWKGKYGADAWAVLEKQVGQLT